MKLCRSLGWSNVHSLADIQAVPWTWWRKKLPSPTH